MITKEQLRAARGLAGFEQKFVAENIGVDPKTISNIENGKGNVSSPHAAKLVNFYETRGVEFTDHNGVRQIPSGVRVYRGNAEFRQFYDDIYETARKVGGEVCLYNAASHLVIGALGADFVKVQQERMLALKDKKPNQFRYRVIFAEGDGTFFGASYCEYRWINPEHFNDTATFVYGDKVGIATFENNDVMVVVIKNAGFAESLKKQFSLQWQLTHEPK
ncbi:helix-turn-helix transcriptional regulator [Pararhizobium sp. IMCC21322]|uniref:helix-turn-helix transcriptional regulator n=1 Tax=Pararhizobium sp. IMCC21322 TaxID=3067903 RepID=UPI0027405BE6|nr:helix-turn-helix transcriptional regulator [Pararhizobium sp. IMCC21322]